MHNRKKKELLTEGNKIGRSKSRLWMGLGILGFASLYREGFEVVLFLQSYYLKMGGNVIAVGAATGLFLTGIVAVFTFLAHRNLPYRKMLVLTGALLGGVLLVMVGEQAQEMQLAHWIPTTEIRGLEHAILPWMGTWFSLFPTVETLLAQMIAAAFVLGSYIVARKTSVSGLR